MHDDDATLLRRYAETRDEPAFGELVRRHLNLVYYAALRQTGGDAALAEEVAQVVFGELARRAASLHQRPVLAGWLYTSTRFAAHKARRAEQRRRQREHTAHLMNELTHDSAAAADWERLRPVIDDALHALDERDREAVLLRFFEGRAFAEIGTKLALTEEAARKRVDRALDKMQSLLARRGVTSTAAALGAAMTGQAALAAPAGLATTVTGAVLAGAAATTVGAGIGASLFSLMSTLKFSGTTAGIMVLLALSLGTNAFLFLNSPEPTPIPAAKPAPAAATLSFSELARSADLASLRDRLRQAGASDAAVRAALTGVLERRYREQLSSERLTRLRRGWWHDPERTYGTANDVQLPFDDLRLRYEMVTKPLERLLGVDPLDEAEAELRYGFLPEAQRKDFAQLERSAIGGWTRSGDPEADAVLEAEMDRLRQTAEERRAALVAALSPEQRVNYDMRFGSFATGLAQQLNQIVATEKEYQALFPIAEVYAKQAEKLGGPDNFAAMQELDRRTVGQLISALGYDRALDYVWAGATEYPAVARVAREAQLPPETAGRVLQLAAETGVRAGDIHVDSSLTVEQKRAALAALQAETRSQLDQLLPAAAQQRLPGASLSWLNGLSDGRYRSIATVLPGRVRVMVSGNSYSIDTQLTPDSLARPTLLVPARPKG